MPPCSGCLLDNSAITAARGTKKTRHARTHSVTDGAPSRALREIHRRPTTATMFIATTSHRVRDLIKLSGVFRKPPSRRRFSSRPGPRRFAIDEGLEFGERCFPAAIHDLEIALPARPLACRALPHRDHRLAVV